jgi:hypothetical protein
LLKYLYEYREVILKREKAENRFGGGM